MSFSFISSNQIITKQQTIVAKLIKETTNHSISTHLTSSFSSLFQSPSPSQKMYINSSIFYTFSHFHPLIFQFSTPKCTVFFRFFGHGKPRQTIGLSISSLLSAAILPEPRPVIFPNDPIADSPMKLLLSSPRFIDLLCFLSFDELTSPASRSTTSSWLLLLLLSLLFWATTNRAMTLLQNGHTGGVTVEVVGFGLLWQHSASVHCAHIW